MTDGQDPGTGLENQMAKMTFAAVNEPADTNGHPSESHRSGERRRGSLERYRPGAYYNEEREKHRRRGHFGENRLQKEEEGKGSGGGDRRGNRNRNKNRGPRKPKNPDEGAEAVEAAEDEPREMEEPKKRLWADDSFEEPVPEPVKSEHHHEDNGRRRGGRGGGHPPPPGDLRDKLNEKRRQNGHPSNDDHQTNGSGRGENRRGHRNDGRSAKGQLPRPKKNTENFNPSYEPPEMRILCAPPGLTHYSRAYGSRDVAVVTDLFVQDVRDLTIYNRLLDEIGGSGVDESLLWQKWHGDSHLIADDKRNWKRKCPTFSWIVDRMADYFQMDVQATRLNWYQNSSDWKPFHHDAAAMKPDKARTQNITVAVSFGAERDAAFERAQNKTVISMPQPNGTIYTFGRDVNILWRHGIPQLPPEKYSDMGRISIICWGWVKQFDM